MSERNRWIRIAALPAMALLMVLWTGSALAQSTAGDPQVPPTTFQGATGEEMDRLEEQEAELVKMVEEGLLHPSTLSRDVSILDRGFGYIWVSNLEFRIWNAGGRRGGGGTQAEWYYGVPAGHQQSRTTFWWDTSHAFGVEDGPWGDAQVHEATDDYYNTHEVADWEATDGARGTEFADPPATRFNVPLMAMSNLENTWPSGGWPAPESVTAVWEGTEMWNPWARVAQVETYGTFDDSEAGRDGLNEAYPLGIEGKVRSLGYGAYDAAFVQLEFTNTSSNTYTGVYVGHHGRRGFPTYYDGNMGYPEWDASRQMHYVIGGGFDPATGFHYNDDITFAGATPYAQAPWGGIVYLESPTGSFRTDDLGNFVDDPTTVITRNAWTHRDNRTDPAFGGNESKLYGTVSGDLSYFEGDNIQAEKVWKMTAAGSGSPVLLQGGDAFNLHYYGSATPTQQDLEDFPQTGMAYTHSGPFTMAPGESINFVYAMVAGETLFDMQNAADKALRSYQAQFQASGPPPSPELVTGGVQAGPAGKQFDNRIHDYRINYVDSGPITLTWDGSEAETYLDPITLAPDFQGYRIYKSIDRGSTWGEVLTTTTAGFGAYAPAAQFDLDDGVTGRDPQGYQSLGDDSGIQHTWTDASVLDGMEYWYAITSYDYDPAQDPEDFSFESGIGTDPNVPNVVSVIAGSKPNGYIPGGVSGPDGPLGLAVIDPTVGMNNAGLVSAAILDDSAVPGATYRITTTDSASYGAMGPFSNTLGITFTNLTSGTVLYESMLPEDGDFGTDLLPIVDGIKVIVDSKWNVSDKDDRISWEFPSGWVPDGGDEMTYGDEWFFSSSIDTDDLTDAATKLFSAEVRIDTVNTQMAYVFNRGGYGYKAYHEVPFTVWDVSGDSPRQVNAAYTVNTSDATNGDDFDISDDLFGTDTRHYLSILNTDYSGGTPDTMYTTGGTMDSWYGLDHVWTTHPGLDPGLRIQDLHGETVFYNYERPIGPGYQYEFTTTAPTNDESVADLDQIRVVPNPYYILAAWDKNENQRKIQFRNVPPNSTVDIYTLSGELLASLDHSESGYNSDQIGTVEWNIWTYEFTEAAYGLYLYVVKTADGQKKVGKFAIIR